MSGRLPLGRSLSLLALATALAAAPSPAAAQAPPVVTDIIPDFDPARDLGTTLSTNAGTHTIDGGTLSGANLFHSFASFSLAQGEIARWVQSSGDPASIAHVVNRVTGGGTSFLSGTIDSTAIPNADFWFINPAGVVFGAGAAVNVPAAAHFSTAGTLRFADGQDFRITTPDGSSLSVAPPSAFGFLGGEAALIADLAGGTLRTPGALTLTASDVTLANAQVSSASLLVAATGGEAADLAPDGSGDVALTGLLAVRNSQAEALATASTDGHIALIGGDVSIIDSNVFADTYGAFDAGGVSIFGDTVTLDNAFVTSETYGDGNGGLVAIGGGSGSFVNDTLIRASSFDAGNAGNVLINFAADLRISDTDIESDAFFSIEGSGAAAGSISIFAADLTIADGSSITADTVEGDEIGRAHV